MNIAVMCAILHNQEITRKRIEKNLYQSEKDRTINDKKEINQDESEVQENE